MSQLTLQWGDSQVGQSYRPFKSKEFSPEGHRRGKQRASEFDKDLTHARKFFAANILKPTLKDLQVAFRSQQ